MEYEREYPESRGRVVIVREEEGKPENREISIAAVMRKYGMSKIEVEKKLAQGKPAEGESLDGMAI